MKQILICATLLSTIKAFLIPHIHRLQEMGYAVDIAGNKNTDDLDHLVRNVYDIPYQRTPFSKLNIRASRELKRIVFSNHYDIVHFHTPVASAFGRWAVRKARQQGTRIIYTAHGFHFYMGAPVLNWIFYYPVEKFLSRYTNVLITINQEDYQRGKSFHAARVEYVPGVGVDIDKFKNEGFDRDAKRRALGLNNDDFMILSVGELNKNKNHAVVIRALAELQRNNVKYYICGKGPLEGELKQLAEKLGVGSQVKLLGFRNDIPELCLAADVFAFPSFREGLPVALMEAMASGLPVVCSNIRGNRELIDNELGGYLLDPQDYGGFSRMIKALIANAPLREQMGTYNVAKIDLFRKEIIVEQMIKIYEMEAEDEVLD